MSGNEAGYVSPECFQAYVSAEIKVPNTLIAVCPYVGRAALAPMQVCDDLDAAVSRFATTFSFSPSQLKSASRTVRLLHGKFGIPVLPHGVDHQGKTGIRVFELSRFEVVYMEGVMNILEAILRLHGLRGQVGSSRVPQVIEVLSRPDALATTLAAFAAAEDAINGSASTAKSEAFKAKFDFVTSGLTPRAMAPADKDGIQAEVAPLLVAAVEQAFPGGKADHFVAVLTSPELHEQAA
jgi:hypothetical protein